MNIGVAMKIRKEISYRLRRRADDGSYPEMPMFIIGREVGFTEWDFNRLRRDKKRCILDYKLVQWSIPEHE
jgi:hypothetical protein